MRSGVVKIGAHGLLAIVLVATIVAACDSAGRRRVGRRSLGRADAPGSDRPGDRDGGDRDRHPDGVRRVLGRPGVDGQRRIVDARQRATPATLAADGGEPAIGQLGSYTWLDGGSDSPWLPGTPLTVGAGEPLTVTVGGGVAVADWSARRVTAGTTDGSGAVALGQAAGPPVAFAAPGRRHLVGPGHGPVRQRSRVGNLLLATHGALNDGIGVAHFPRRCRPDPGHAARRPVRAAVCAVGLAVMCAIVMTACSNQAETPGTVPAGLLALAAGPGGTTLTGWDATGADGTPIKLPQGETTWISAGRAAVLAATLASGKTSTSDPVHLGKPLAWRPVKAKVPTGETPAGPDYFATWDPEGGRFATLAGDLLSGDGIRLVLVDPSAQTAFEITLDRSVVAAPPVWIDGDRVAVVTGDAAAPTSAIVDTTTGEIGDGPAGGAAPGDLRDRAPDRHDGGPGCADRDPRHRRLAGRRWVTGRLDRAAGRIHDRHRVRPRLERPAAGGGLGRPGWLGDHRHPRRPLRLAPRSATKDRPRQRRRRSVAPLSASKDQFGVARDARCPRVVASRTHSGALAPVLDAPA